MATTKKLYSQVPNGGFNQASKSHALGRHDYNNLVNMRPFIGSLEQTDLIGTYFNLALQTDEGSATQCHFIAPVRTGAGNLRYLIINEKNGRFVDPTNTGSQTLIPSIVQSAVPNNTTVNGQLLLYGFNSTDFATTGDQIDVNIHTDTTHFRWRRNGGAYSADIVIANGQSIGANGLKLGWLATTGFTVGDTWSWVMSNVTPNDSNYYSSTLSNANYQLDNYFGGIGRTIMRQRDGFLTTVGYKRAYGKYVAIFQNHLVIAHFAEGIYDAITGVTDPYSLKTTPFNIAWSDLNNPDDLFPDNTHEAGSYNIPYNTYPDNINLGITGLAPIRDTLMIYLPDCAYEMTYLGLPNVMQILPKFAGVGSYYPNGLVDTKRGHYFMSRDNFYYYDGTSPVPIGESVREKVFGEIVGTFSSRVKQVFSYYDSARQEVVWTYWTFNPGGGGYQSRQVVFQERYNRWFFRNIPCADTDSAGEMQASCQRVLSTVSGTNTGLWSPNTRLYAGVGAIATDIPSGVSNPLSTSLKDFLAVGSSSGSYSQPTIETNDFIYSDFFYKKEGDGFYIDATWDSESVSMSGVALGVDFHTLLTAAASFQNVSEFWTSTIRARRLSLPQTSGSYARFRLIFTGTKPAGCKLYGYGDFIYDGGLVEQ